MPESSDVDQGATSNLAIKVFFGIGISALLGTCAAILSPPGREIIASFRDFSTTVEEGATAVGMAELRAIGCDDAFSVPVEEMAKFTSSLSDEFDAEKTLEGVPPGTRWVQCHVELSTLEIPACGAVARTYGAATSANDPFIVVSGKPGTTLCSGYYTSDGIRLGAMSRSTLALDPD